MECVAGPQYTSSLGKIGTASHICRWLTAYFLNFLTLLASLALPQTKEHSQLNSSSAGAELCDEPFARESRPPSPSRPTITERDIISSVVSRLGDLEKQIETLHLRKSEMPHEKEELLNAAVYRVDALEAELIATKKVQSSMI